MAAPNEAPEVVGCTSCGRQTLKVDEHDFCECCAARMDGYNAGESEGVRLMLHLAIAGARMEMRDDAEVRRIFEYVMGGGENPYHVDGVS